MVRESPAHALATPASLPLPAVQRGLPPCKPASPPLPQLSHCGTSKAACPPWGFASGHPATQLPPRAANCRCRCLTAHSLPLPRRSIDLAHLLRRFGLEVCLCTITMGPNPAYANEGFYAEHLQVGGPARSMMFALSMM